MSNEIIDITQYFRRGAESDEPPARMALWGADGERSRFALPLWRIVYLAEAERGVILWRRTSGDRAPRPFVVLDLACDPARIELPDTDLPFCEEADSGALHDLISEGLIVYLGARDDRVWCLLADGGGTRTAPLQSRHREDILFLAGECAGLLFLRDFDDGVEDQTDPTD